MQPADEDLNELKEYSVTGSVFQIGCSASLLTIHAQQRRAFLLVRLLQKTETLHDGMDVAVIGGGIAGITAALALHVSKAKVTIYESASQVVHLQRRNTTRFLHPFIASWPKPGFGYPITHLPYMNWRAEQAGHVTEQLLKQWEFFENEISVRVNTKVKRIEHVPGENPKVLFSKGKPKARSHQLVIIAVGYGLEAPSCNMTPSYWRNDDFEQVLFPHQGGRFLVSGTGDGGLTEILRLIFLDFHHKRFLQKIMYDSELRQEAREINRELEGAGKRKTSSFWSQYTSTDFENTAARPEYLQPARLRTDTAVSINSKQSCVFITRAQILHKILVAKLIKIGAVKTVISGQLVDNYTNKHGRCVAVIRGARASRDKFLIVDKIIERHPSERTFDVLVKNLVGEKTAAALPKGGNFTNAPALLVGLLADEFMAAHFEKSYEVGFLLDEDESALSCSKSLFASGSIRARINVDSFSGRRNVKSKCTLDTKQFSLSVEKKHFTELRKDVDCLVLRTSSRYVLENVLWQQARRYNFLRIYTAWPKPTFEPPCEIETFRNTETGTLLFYHRDEKYFEIQSAKLGLFEAYRLFRIPTLIQIMSNSWPLKKVHGYAWAGENDRLTNKRKVEGNKLLEWDD